MLSSGGPSSQAQYMLQLINMARTNPQAAAQWVSNNVTPEVTSTLKHYNVDVNAVKQTIANSNPLPPVAWNSNLASAAQGHSQDMADNQYQSHTGSDGSSSDDRIKSAGYTNAKSSGENAYAYAGSVDNAMEAFLYDWGVSDAGHRRNLLQPGVSPNDSFRDVGIGIVNTGGKLATGKIGPVIVTQDFGSQPNAQAQLVGVAYSDNDGSQFYTPGEGAGNVRIDAVNLDDGSTASTTTWDSGGYELPLAPGRYKVTASQNNVVIQDVNVTIGTVNVEQDFVLSNPWNGRSLTPATPAAVRTVAAAAVAPKAVAVPTAASASTPTTTAATTTPSPNFAFFAPSDWKGPVNGTPTVQVAKAAMTTVTPTVSYQPALANWTTWKAKSV
ncbi:MAG: CAP domain-containing protein [Paludisphaera borealis]|uniref:CAP domain-containing protein n=1 Tax=Paludisphaera borealis TaxID=1387353 RepID=UPI00283BFEE4|nr:CAP domain-containing protein [Paludisphaera borealis]MDR3621529.1 CAP domain-containing protein [Paludisphaera borealis]